MKKRIHTGELSPGMYVSCLDGAEPQPPFRFEGMYINSDEDIKRLAELCEYVYIDLSRCDRYAFLRLPGSLEA